MARSFNGTTQYIETSAGAMSGAAWDYGTVAAVLRKGSNFDYMSILCLGNGSGSDELDWEITDGNVMYYAIDSAPSFTNYALQGSYGSSTNYIFLCVTKASGTSTPRAHMYDYASATWTHADFGSVVTAGTRTTVTTVSIGRFSAASTDMFLGDIAIIGLFRHWNPGDAELEAVGMHTEVTKWLTAANRADKAGVWVLDQSDTAINVIDLTGGGANQSGQVAPGIATTSVPILGYGAITDLFVAAPAAGTNVSVPAPVLETETNNAPTLSSTAGVTPNPVLETETRSTPTVSATAGVTPNPVLETETNNAPTLSSTAGVTPSPVLETETNNAPSLSSTAGVTPNPVLETETNLTPTVGVVTNVDVPAPVLETETNNSPTVSANVSGSPVLETETNNAPTLSSTAAVTPNPVLETEQFGAATVSTTAGVTPNPVLETETRSNPTISTTADVTPNPVLETETNLTPVVTTPANATPNPVPEVENTNAPTFSTTANPTPNPVVETETFPSSTVDNGSGGPSYTGRRGGTTWIDEPWNNWPVEEEVLTV